MHSPALAGRLPGPPLRTSEATHSPRPRVVVRGPYASRGAREGATGGGHRLRTLSRPMKRRHDVAALPLTPPRSAPAPPANRHYRLARDISTMAIRATRQKGPLGDSERARRPLVIETAGHRQHSSTAMAAIVQAAPVAGRLRWARGGPRQMRGGPRRTPAHPRGTGEGIARHSAQRKRPAAYARVFDGSRSGRVVAPMKVEAATADAATAPRRQPKEKTFVDARRYQPRQLRAIIRQHSPEVALRRVNCDTELQSCLAHLILESQAYELGLVVT